MTRSAIVLAGGRSVRFGAGKLAADLGGRPLLAATIDAVSSVVEGVILAGPALPEGFEAGETPIAVVPDVEPFGGPLAALATVLASARPARPEPPDLAILVGGDMPRVVPAVLTAMLDRLEAEPSIDALLLEPPPAEAPPPRRQVLPLAIRIEAAAEAARVAVAEGDRSLQSFVDRLPHRALASAEWLPLDPDGRTLTDVDTRADLERLRRP